MLDAPLVAGSFDENAPHGLGGGGEEVAPTIPVLGLLHVDQPLVGFMDEGRRLERLPGLFASQPYRGQLPELVVDEGQQLAPPPSGRPSRSRPGCV